MTENISVDVAVIGAGFVGSLTALLLNRIGLRVVLLESGSHPRFAIGESSTPIADLILGDLAQRYDLPSLLPLSHYGTWKQTYPDLNCGLKRGFSYFKHRPEQPFHSLPDHSNELLVAASRDDEHSDTHWMRSDVDTFLVNQVKAAGIPYYDQMKLTHQQHWPTWQLRATSETASLAIQAEFLIDATGEAAFLPRALDLSRCLHQLRTSSRSLFAHFTDVTPWQDILTSQHSDTNIHPFCCDAAALHHVLEEGWMWQLRFDNCVTSVGITLDADRHPLNSAISADKEWEAILNRYPSLGRQFATAQIIAPERGLTRTGRLQRQWSQIVGDNWALLPHTAGFIDPFFSAGIAHTLCGVENLVHLLENYWGRESLSTELRVYEMMIKSEFELIDKLVQGSYLSLRNFDLFVPFTMLYFAAATTYEHRRLKTGYSPGRAFLCADDGDYRRIVSQIRHNLEIALRQTDLQTTHRFFNDVAQAIAPYNIAGLCDLNVSNMYRYTAV